jgi:hypothetical protein
VTGDDVPTAAELRDKAREHRERALRETDPEHRKALLLVANEYDKLANELDGGKPRSH